MKRKLIIIISVIIISASTSLSLALLFFAYLSGSIPGMGSSGKNLASEINKYKESKLKNTSAYNIKADIDLTHNVVTVEEEITLKTADSRIYVYLPSANIAETKINKVTAGYGTTRFTRRDTMLEINCEPEQDHLNIAYEIELSDGSKTLSYSNKYSYLTNFLITPAVYRKGVLVPTYRSPYGDPYIYDTNNYHIIFKTDGDMDIYAPGEKEERSFGSNKITIFEASNLRDFPAVLCKKADVKKLKHGKTSFYFINSSDSTEYVKHAFEYAEKEIGPYPYKELFVVKMPLEALSGMEFSNMIFLSDSCFKDKELLKRVSYHEVFHQWFYGIIGTDQLDEPFFDEGLATYLSTLLSNGSITDSYNGQFTKMHLDDYKTREQYYSLAYNDSAAYFCNIHRKLGNNFFKMLQRIYNERKFQIIYFEDFNRYIGGYANNPQ